MPANETRSDGEIARSVPLKPILPLAEERFGLPPEALTPYGHHKAKVSLDHLSRMDSGKAGKLVLVTAVSPTPAGEGKTTTSIGLNDALNRIGVDSTVCLREPSLGPCFGMKGGAAGGGWAQVAPMVDINLHFNGDLHAITAANNLLAALLDNHLYWGNELDIDVDAISWQRALDLNDRALRRARFALGRRQHRTGGFDITAASEIMAVLCLAQGREDLLRRLGDIVVGPSKSGKPVRVRDLAIEGSLAALLNDALHPNLVQTLEGNPAFVHGGPFANIAHGCNTVVSTKAALGLSDVVVTEAGFGADLGAQKFLDIKCRQSGLRPDAVVLVCTVRALKMHGGVAQSALDEPDVAAVQRGTANLARHIANIKQYGLPPVVAVNRFTSDTDDEVAAIEAVAAECGVSAVAATHWADGGAGATALAEAVVERLRDAEATDAKVELLYDDAQSLVEKIEAIAHRIYGASSVEIDPAAAKQLAVFEDWGYGQLPVCIAKTQYSFSSDPKALGAPVDHVLPVREARLSAGAGFVVVLTGAIMTMPGLPRRPAAMDIRVDDDGQVVGVF